MPISLRHLICLTSVALLLIAGGCATPVPVERDLARDAVMDADRAGAQKMAIVEFLEAQTTLERGEALLEEGDDEEAKETLITAIVLAHQAETTTYIRSLNLAENRIRQLEVQKATLLQAWREAIADHEAIIDFSDKEELQPTELTSYTVTEGENLFAIAGSRKVYGDALLWPLIYKANRDQIKDPQQIYPGQRLSIPREVSEQEKEEARNTARESKIFQSNSAADKSN